MDWPKARAILLAAFAVVNLILAYSIWEPSSQSMELTSTVGPQSVQQLREKLLAGGLVLPLSVTVPRTPAPMRFLRVEAQPTPEFAEWSAALFGSEPSGPFIPSRLAHLKPALDPDTHATVFWPHATGAAAREVHMDNLEQVQSAAEDYLRQAALMPPGARFSRIYPGESPDTQVVEFVPYFDGMPVYSGYVRVQVSPRGTEQVSVLWVVPRGYTEAPAKAVRPPEEALLRLAGRFIGVKQSTITEVQLGYYAGRALSIDQGGDVHGWDTIPVWRITLDSGDVYYINAFNGELES